MVWVSGHAPAANAATPSNGRCAWHICCAMRAMPSSAGDTSAFSAPFKKELLLRAIAIGQTTRHAEGHHV